MGAQVSLAAATLFLSGLARANGFFDDLPRRGYIRDDVSYDVVRRGAGVDRTLVATLRYMKLVLDPSRRDLAGDLWPEREMLLIQHASGEKIIFERISKPLEPRNPEDPQPRSRIGLDGSAVEIFVRGSGPATPDMSRPSACAGSFAFLHAGSRELPVAPEDLEVPTVRMGITQFLDAALSPSDRDLIERSVQIVLRASQSRSLPAGTLEILKTLFPGKTFAPSSEGLSFEAPQGKPLDPADGSWRSTTEAPEMLAGIPLY
jgi:hypothetical protein